jgi:hypothetical protein
MKNRKFETRTRPHFPTRWLSNHTSVNISFYSHLFLFAPVFRFFHFVFAFFGANKGRRESFSHKKLACERANSLTHCLNLFMTRLFAFLLLIYDCSVDVSKVQGVYLQIDGCSKKQIPSSNCDFQKVFRRKNKYPDFIRRQLTGYLFLLIYPVASLTG